MRLCNFVWKGGNKTERYGNNIIGQLLSAFVGQSMLIRYVLAENRRSPHGWSAIYLLEKGTLEDESSSLLRLRRSIGASSVLSRIQFGHCSRFYLQRGITIAVVYGWTAVDVRTNRSAASSINLISNALSTFAFSFYHARRPPQLLNEQEFSILSSALCARGESSLCSRRVVFPCYWPLPGSWN